MKDRPTSLWGDPMATRYLILASGLAAWLGAEVLLLTLHRF
jgi:hypothetical protein